MVSIASGVAAVFGAAAVLVARSDLRTVDYLEIHRAPGCADGPQRREILQRIERHRVRQKLAAIRRGLSVPN